MAVDTFLADIGDVDDLLIWNVRDATDPPPSAIEGWIELAAAELYGVTGTIGADDPCGGDQYRHRARHIVALYAAAMAEAAHYPERASDRDSGDYVAWLWARHTAQVASLKTDLEACRDGLNPGTARGGAAHSFPSPPMFARDMPG